MQTSDVSTTETLRSLELPNGKRNEKRELESEKKLMLTNENDTPQTEKRMQRNKTTAAYGATPILVSEQQFNTVREEHLTSMDLLNSSGHVLLQALNSMQPPEGSGRVVGEYTAQGMRQISKSICDIIQTKTQVIRSMYQIARDEI